MARSYSCPGLRRVSPATRQGRPMCRCVIADGAKLLAWVGCKRCLGTGGDGAPVTHELVKLVGGNAQCRGHLVVRRRLARRFLDCLANGIDSGRAASDEAWNPVHAPKLIEDGTTPLIVMATTGLFNNKDQAEGSLNIYQKDEDQFGEKSAWDRLRERQFDGQRRPLLIILTCLAMICREFLFISRLPQLHFIWSKAKNESGLR